MDMSTTWRTIGGDPLVRPAALLSVAVACIGLAYGAQTVAAGLPWWFAPALAVTVLAASSEMLFVGLIAAGGAPIVAFAAGALVNARHLPYGLAAAPYLGSGPARWARIHLINDESVALALAQRDVDAGRRGLTYAGAGIALAWPLGAAAGAAVGSVISPEALGLDAVFPAVILALLIPALREARTRGPLVVAALLALAAVPWAPTGLAPVIALFALPAMRLVRGSWS
ncbi:AzlC family protein OS=Tsukamurella paurometabola (strain ATCC 8368 / DSM / CCUG 35730 / CIP 100753 / JCM 10117 / KCTC 9821 / NBRC 16120 / NCIMB 702349/ NCTC 13040) OX=521096 GN=Tpau_3185 PE=3 SV=1 [Tsukamurella paurometabola]|uniref:AzlC family protein n=2 Tax=Tsukamurella paurometabola TaxID=2061 RepID=D5UVJ0_TSUPD|nr:AzlC family protein [Tsukamurella paurometabola DSM 20162]SUP37152.1 azaleucine resistance protein AzlC [Tsukamurella paurometabola]